jgi:hypothetical protein
MTTYNVKHTDRTVPSISVPETEVNDTALDVSLFGRIHPEYGAALDEDLLNILEHFSCPEDSASVDFDSAFPDLTVTSAGQLSNPTIGQFWYNTTRQMMYYWKGTVWYPLPLRENYAANWGSLLDGQQLPKPVSPINGHVFDYEDCIWSVAPAAFLGKTAFMSCGTDQDAYVTMRYRLSGTSTTLIGLANYLIIGIRGNYNAGQFIPPFEQTVTPTPTPSPTPTSTTGPVVTVTPTQTAEATVTPQVTPTLTPTMSITPTPGITATPTLTPTVTPTITATVTPSPTAEATPAVTPTVTPTVSEEPIPPGCACEGAYELPGGGFAESFGNYATLEECELDIVGSQSCEFGGVGCWQRVDLTGPLTVDCPALPP